jgi:hypothetical protein
MPYYRAIPRHYYPRTGMNGIGLTDFPLRQGWPNPMVVGQQPAPAPTPPPAPAPAPSLLPGVPNWLLAIGAVGGLFWLWKEYGE